MIQHVPANDALLVVWWAELLKHEEEMDCLFYDPRLHQLGDFIAYWRTVELHYTLDAQGVMAAVWLEKCLNGAFVGLWIAPRKRKSGAVVREVVGVIEDAVRRLPVVFAITCQERLLEPAQRLGFEVLGGYNGFWDQRKAWLLAMTRETVRWVGSAARAAREYAAQP